VGLGQLNPGCNCDCCRIWLDGCNLRWECQSDIVQVVGNGSIVSKQKSGTIYRPTAGLWQLKACNGAGCSPFVVGSVNVPVLSASQCPPPTCCTGKTYARYQVPAFQYSAFSQTARDYRVNIGGQLIGRNCTTIRLSESIDFDFGGSYLFPIQPGCSHSVNQLIGTATLISNGLIVGTHTTQQQGALAGQTITCPLNVQTYAEVDLEIWARRNPLLGTLFFEAITTGGWWQSLYQGIGYQSLTPVIFNCDQRFLPYETIETLQPRVIARHSPSGSVAGLCSYSGPWIVGPGGLTGFAGGLLAYGLWAGAYNFIVGGGTTFGTVSEDLALNGIFPAVPPPSFVAGQGFFDYV